MNHLTHLLGTLSKNEPSGKTSISEAIFQLLPLIKKRSLCILFSDLLEEPEKVIKIINVMKAKKHEVIVFHVLHEDEIQLPSASDALFIDSESRVRLRLNVDDIRSTYQRKMTERLKSWERCCRTADIDYHLLTTSMPYHEALEKYLCRRTSAM